LFKIEGGAEEIIQRFITPPGFFYDLRKRRLFRVHNATDEVVSCKLSLFRLVSIGNVPPLHQVRNELTHSESPFNIDV
jgi:hypothetical protein